MFHQVQVPDQDSTFLCFLWWDDGDTMWEVQEYQMLAHLFGAISSDASANFTLQKTADDNRDCFPTKVINTKMRNNFYFNNVFDLSEWCHHTVMLTTIRPTFKRRLQAKWVSNSRKVLQAIPIGASPNFRRSNLRLFGSHIGNSKATPMESGD